MATNNKGTKEKAGRSAGVILLSIGIILLMFKSNRILYVRYLQDTHVYILAFICMAFYAIRNWRTLEQLSMFKGVSIMLLASIFLYDRWMLSDMSMRGIMCLCITVTGAALLVMAPLRDKQFVLKWFTGAIVLILVIALAGWIPFLMGVPLPHFKDTNETYYMHEVYYIFNTFAISSPGDVYRFAGPFLEPGHLGSMCVYLLYIGQFNLKKFTNIILLVSTLMSLSLAAYGMMVGAIILILIEKRKYIAVGIMAAVFVGIGVGATFYLNGDNVLNKAIVSRLEVTESGEIAGNNRYTTFFKDTFDKYLKTDKIWLGVGDTAYSSKNSSNGTLMMGNAGYKRYFYLRGIVGTSLIVIFLLMYFSKYVSLKTFGFLVIYVISNLIRDYPTKEIWMYLYLMAIPVLYFEGRTPRKRDNNKTKKSNIGNARVTPVYGS